VCAERQDMLLMNSMDEREWSLPVLRLSSNDFLVSMIDEDETASALQVKSHEQ